MAVARSVANADSVVSRVITELQQSLRQLQAERDSLDAQIVEIRDALERLGTPTLRTSSSSKPRPGAAPKVPRRTAPKSGPSVQERVMAVMNGDRTREWTPKDIVSVDSTVAPSVRTVLQRFEKLEVVAKTGYGRYRLKESPLS